MWKSFEGFFDFQDFVMKTSVCLFLMIQHAPNLEDWLANLRVMFLMMTRGRLVTAADSRVVTGTCNLRLENLLREVLEWRSIDGLWRWMRRFPFIFHDVDNRGSSEIENKSLMLVDLLRSLQDTCWLSGWHSCLICHFRFVEGVLKRSCVNLGEISCRVILSQPVKCVHTLEPSRFLSCIRPESALINWATLLLTGVLLELTKAAPILLATCLRALKAISILVSACQRVSKVHTHISHTVRIRNCYGEILIDFAVRLNFCKWHLPILVRCQRKCPVDRLRAAA
jgi:hypothetical protein